MRKCKFEDLQAIYRLCYSVDSKGQIILGTEDTDFDEYYCNNCDLYSSDFDSNHVGA